VKIELSRVGIIGAESFISELSVSKSKGTLDVASCNMSWGRQGYECPSDVGRVTRS